MNVETFGGKEKQTKLFTQLRLLGVAKVDIVFSGSGDSGQVDEVTLLGPNNTPLPDSVVETLVDSTVDDTHHDGKQWVTTTKQATISLNKVLQQLCYTALEETTLDWYNNDGGQGTFNIDLTQDPPSAELTVEVNYMSSETSTFEYEN